MPPAFRPRPAVLAAAVALDLLLGDPPTALHPVGWIGRAVRALEGWAPPVAGPRRRFGIAAAVAVPLLAAGLAWGWGRTARTARTARWARRGGAVVGLLAEAAALDATFALSTLLRRAEEVRRALDVGDLPAARALLARHLVSRDTHDLSAAEVAGATIESVAENLSDGAVAPWLAYALAGLPGAFAYRAVNTLDSMWGYRSVPYADLGFASARLDDGANWLPARGTALAIAGAAAVLGEDAGGAVEAWWRDGATTESPNAGRPMAAMAGALGVELTKREAYTLGVGGRAPVADDIARAIRVARVAALLALVAVTGVVATVSGAGPGPRSATTRAFDGGSR